MGIRQEERGGGEQEEEGEEAQTMAPAQGLLFRLIAKHSRWHSQPLFVHRFSGIPPSFPQQTQHVLLPSSAWHHGVRRWFRRPTCSQAGGGGGEVIRVQSSHSARVQGQNRGCGSPAGPRPTPFGDKDHAGARMCRTFMQHGPSGSLWPCRLVLASHLVSRPCRAARRLR